MDGNKLRVYTNLCFMEHIQKFQYIERTSMHFPITSVDREKSEDNDDLYFMAFALKGKVLKIVK